MSYKIYLTYIYCVILNNIQIQFKPSRTYIHIQQSVVFGHLLLHMHYLMAPPGLVPGKSQQQETAREVPTILVLKSTGLSATGLGTSVEVVSERTDSKIGGLIKPL